MSKLLIGAVSNETGVSIETIRYYERAGILDEPSRSQGGHREYDHEQLKRINFVKRCRDLGFSLKEVRNLLTLVASEEQSCKEVHDVTVKHLDNVRRKLSDLKKLEQALVEMSEKCAEGASPQCPIIEVLFD